MVWPTGLHFDRYHVVVTSLFQEKAWLGALGVLAGIGWLVWLYVKKRRSEFALWFFGLGIFFSGLSLSSGIFATINGLIYEHWLYFPLFGFVTIVAWYFDKLWLYAAGRSKRFATVLAVLFIAYCTFLAAGTVALNRIWANPAEFFKNIIRYEPGSYKALNNLGNWYYNSRQFSLAEKLWDDAVAANPANAVTLANLGGMAAEEGDSKRAEELMKMALKYDPGYFDSYALLEELYIREKRVSDAKLILSLLKNTWPNENYSDYDTLIAGLESGSSTAATSTKTK
jgi:tetratricopeptide (TPR) repeat protein